MKYIFATAVLFVLLSLPTQVLSDYDHSPVPIAFEAMVPSNTVPDASPVPFKSAIPDERPLKAAQNLVFAYVTGYNTTAAQTDSGPCEAAGGNICGRKDTVACPPSLALLSWVTIAGKKYQCMDRTAPQFKNRFDISCDKDALCPAKVTGWKNVVIE